VRRCFGGAGNNLEFAYVGDQNSRNNKTTALILASIVAVFFFGIMLKYLLLK
jgi:hypothetical protein